LRKPEKSVFNENTKGRDLTIYHLEFAEKTVLEDKNWLFFLH